MLFIYHELMDIQSKIGQLNKENFGRYPSGPIADLLLDRRDKLEVLLKEHSAEEYSQYVQEYYG